jgi:hypothetical protein
MNRSLMIFLPSLVSCARLFLIGDDFTGSMDTSHFFCAPSNPDGMDGTGYWRPLPETPRLGPLAVAGAPLCHGGLDIRGEAGGLFEVSYCCGLCCCLIYAVEVTP